MFSSFETGSSPTGTFDFDKADTIGVQKLDAKGAWRRIGELDTLRSKPGVVVIDPTEYPNPNQTRIVEENQQLRFYFGISTAQSLGIEKGDTMFNIRADQAAGKIGGARTYARTEK
jgi:hypothetical protein